MKKIILTLLALWFTYILFILSMEETNAYNPTSYRWVPVIYESNYCEDIWFSASKFDACYYYDNKKNWKKRNTIWILHNDIGENDMKQLLSHEFGHSIYDKLTKQEQSKWEDIYNGKYDERLVELWVDISWWKDNWRDYALSDSEEMFSDMNAYYQTREKPKNMNTKYGLSWYYMSHLRDKYNITK